MVLGTASMSTGSKGSGGQLSSGGNSVTEATNGNHSDADDLDNDRSEDGNTTMTSGGGGGDHGAGASGGGGSQDTSDAWWSVGEFLDSRQVTHHSTKLTLTGNRVFTNNQKEDMWDLTDSLAELYEVSQKFESVNNTTGGTASTVQLNSRRVPASSAASSVANFRQNNNNNTMTELHQKEVDIQDWLSKDPTHGFIRVYPSSNASSQVYGKSQLVPCTLSTSAHKICLVLGISINALHVQMNGDIIRRLDPYEHPLVLQNEYLTNVGISDMRRIQSEGTLPDLAYLIKFFSGEDHTSHTFTSFLFLSLPFSSFLSFSHL